MKKVDRIRRVSAELLQGFFVYFSVGVLFAFFRGKDVNVLEELFDAAVFSVIYFAANYVLRKKKAAGKANGTE